MDRDMLNIDYTMDELLPHSGGSILLDKVLSYEKSGVRCSTKITSDMRYANEEDVELTVGLELMAQAIAAFVGIQRLEKSEVVKVGFLISCRKFTLHVPKLQFGDQLEVSAELIRDGQLAAFNCHVHREQTLICEGVLNVYDGKLNE